jgi:hypothetical protein
VSHDLQQTVALLERTPAVLDSLLRDLPDEWTLENEGPGTWSVFDVVGHLVYCERANFLPRTKIILELGEAQGFEPFDRWGHVKESHGKSLGQLLDEFLQLRAENIRVLRTLHLTEEDLKKRGKHAAFGTITLSELLATWAAHDLNHLHQISRVMAFQYRENVGPWSKFLGVMHCNGHSAPG